MDKFNDLQLIKRQFFAMRNGVIADTLRKNGSPFRIIFGLNLPQIIEIAQRTGVRPDLAERLWANTTTRESMLLAPMLLDPASVTNDVAVRMASQAPCAEVADILCHRLLRKMPGAFDLAMSLSESVSPMSRYCSMRILWHFLSSELARVRSVAENEIQANDPLTLRPATQIIEELDFLAES